jgi:hypothetical protein
MKEQVNLYLIVKHAAAWQIAVFGLTITLT